MGPLAQSVEHLTFNQVVAGSIPARPTNHPRRIVPLTLFAARQILLHLIKSSLMVAG
jgi:hypothetical protein